MNDIDTLLRDDARAALDDAGFTARVMGALPARAPQPRAWLRPVLVMGSAAVGSALAVALAPAGLLGGFAEIIQWRAATPAALSALAISGALLASAVILATDLD
ncbi:MAG TPA: hypothetical protein VM122_08335 [Usitatibacter sp.]|nr:hypothetical protein [Usitatibacter sp.]